ncbi:sensor domain-containing protein, partial [Streptomyces sp. NPDC059810]|uniref:sensor domain-containing protein n=1 Tax=Streptomyces sp. NPDC059810 TaxID=3346956 RepID=UPI0036488C12
MTADLDPAASSGAAVAPSPRPRPPKRTAYGKETWKEIVFLLSNLFTALVGFVYAVVSVLLGVGLSVTVIGLPLLALGLGGARLIGRSERARARALLGVAIAEPSPLPSRGGFFGWLWSTQKDPVAWRTQLYGLIRLPWGIVTFTVALVSLIVLWPVLPFLSRGMATADRGMVRGLLSPSDELERRIAELESDRGVVVDTAAADLRRLDRGVEVGGAGRRG